MPKLASGSLESVIRDSIARAVAEVAPRLARLVAAAAAGRAGRDVAPTGKTRGARPGRKPRPPRVEITRWAADARARRVPTFVIEATGLDTKRRIVAKYGPATFEKGKPLPPALGEKRDGKVSARRKADGRKRAGKQAAPATERKAPPREAAVVVARPPIVRKRSAIA